MYSSFDVLHKIHLLSSYVAPVCYLGQDGTQVALAEQAAAAGKKYFGMRGAAIRLVDRHV